MTPFPAFIRNTSLKYSDSRGQRKTAGTAADNRQAGLSAAGGAQLLGHGGVAVFFSQVEWAEAFGVLLVRVIRACADPFEPYQAD